MAHADKRGRRADVKGMWSLIGAQGARGRARRSAHARRAATDDVRGVKDTAFEPHEGTLAAMIAPAKGQVMQNGDG